MNRGNRTRSCFIAFARSVAIAILLAVSVYSVSQDMRQTANANAGKEEQEIKQSISLYAKAANEADPTLALHIWCDSSEDSLINPVGRWHGVEPIMGFYRHDMGEMYSSRNLKISDVSVQVYSDAAWAEFDWEFSATRRRRVLSIISWHGNPDLPQESRRLVFGSYSLFRFAC